VQTATYYLAMPMFPSDVGERRPLPGNYLVWATLGAPPEVVQDKQALMNALGRQIEQYEQAGGNEVVWALMRSSRKLPLRCYWKMLQGKGNMRRYAAGFSYNPPIRPAVRTFLGQPVDNFWGNTTTTAPPGWNVVLSRHENLFSLILTWCDGFLREPTVQRLRTLLIEEVQGEQARRHVGM
jgi:hypothetical protein